MARAVWWLVPMIALAACSEPESRAPRLVPPPPEPAPLVAPAPPVPVASASVSSPRYVLEIRPIGEYAVAQDGRFEIELRTLGTSTLDPAHDTHVVLLAPTGLGLSRSEYTKQDAVRPTPRRIRFEIPTRPSQTGAGTVSATVEFSLCEADVCEPQTVAIGTDLVVR